MTLQLAVSQHFQCPHFPSPYKILISVTFVEACLAKVELYKEQNLSILLSCSAKSQMLITGIATLLNAGSTK